MSISQFKGKLDESSMKSQKILSSQDTCNLTKIFQSDKHEWNNTVNHNEQNNEQSSLKDIFQKENDVKTAKDEKKTITYPFNWGKSQHKYTNNVDLFMNKQASSNESKCHPFKTIKEENCKVHSSSFHHFDKNQMLLEATKENNMKNHQKHLTKEKQSTTFTQENDISFNHSISSYENEDEKASQFKECYLDLLIIAAENLMKKGIGITEHKKQVNCEKIPLKGIRLSNQIFQKNCENKICPVTVTKITNIFQTKMGTQKNKVQWLCIQCHDAWKNGQYCYYCGVIYREYNGRKGFNDSAAWIGCDYCKNWEHIKCEELKGNYSNLSSLIKKDSKFKYKCPICLKKSNENNEKTSKNSMNNKPVFTHNFLQKKTMANNDDYKALFKSSKNNYLG